MRDVAEAAGVSTATVSNVLHGLRFVGPEKRRRAVAPAVGDVAHIGIVVPDITTSFFSAMVRRLEELAAGSNYQILLAESQEDTLRERERIQALIGRQADGLIVVPCVDRSPALDDIRQSGTPAVIFDRVAAEIDFDSVEVDNIGAAREGTRHLVALGHRDIAFLASDAATYVIGETVEVNGGQLML